VGDFGLGSDLVNVADFDALAASGVYVNPLGSEPGAPTAVSNWHLLHCQNTASIATQLAFRPDDIRMRRKNGGVWGSWVKILHQNAILGTVSQSGGVPTGALIEAGSNANGNYVRYAGGMQLAWKRLVLTGQDINTAYGSLYRSAALLTGNTAHAAAFAAAPTVAITAHVSDVSAFTVVGGTGDTLNLPSSAYAVYTSALTGRTIIVNALALGRWY